MRAALSFAGAANWSVNSAQRHGFYGRQPTLNVIGITPGGYRTKISCERSAPWCCTSHLRWRQAPISVFTFSYHGDSHEPDKSESAWRVAPVQASLPGLAGLFELRPVKPERRHFARYRLVARRRALQAGDAVLGALKTPDTGASFDHAVASKMRTRGKERPIQSPRTGRNI